MISNRSVDIPDGHSPDPDFYIMGKVVLDPIGECKIEIWQDETNDIPHFHLSSLNNKFETCICIYSIHYLSHKDNHNDILTNDQCETLNKYLKTESKVMKFTVWDAIRTMWEICNPGSIFSDNEKSNKQPNYDKLPYNTWSGYEI